MGTDQSPQTLENSRRKAYTALTFRLPSGDTAKARAAGKLLVIEGTVVLKAAFPSKRAPK